MTQDDEFWRTPKVTAIVGLSRTEIYRRIAAGTFPATRTYPGEKDRRRTFWLASEVRAWQRSVLTGRTWQECLTDAVQMAA